MDKAQTREKRIAGEPRADHERGAGVRDKIVQAATACLRESGYNACSVQDITDRAQVPKGSFYNYFKSKELLALEVLRGYTDGSRRAALRDRGVAPLARLRSHFEYLAARHASVGYAKGCMIGVLAAEASDDTPLLRDAVAASLADWTSAMTAAISDGQADGSIASGIDAAMLARFLLNGWEGAVMRMKVVATREPLDDFFTVVFPLLARGADQGGVQPTSRSTAP